MFSFVFFSIDNLLLWHIPQYYRQPILQLAECNGCLPKTMNVIKLLKCLDIGLKTTWQPEAQYMLLL